MRPKEHYPGNHVLASMREWLSISSYFLGATTAVGCAMLALIQLHEPAAALLSDLPKSEGKSPRIEAWRSRLQEEKLYAARRAAQEAEEAGRFKTLFASAKSFPRVEIEAPPAARPKPVKVVVRQRKRPKASSYAKLRRGNSALAYGEMPDRAKFDEIFMPLRDSSRDGS
jgi:hypothetical protein